MTNHFEELKANIIKEKNKLFSLFGVSPEFIKDIEVAFKDSVDDGYVTIIFEQGFTLHLYDNGKTSLSSGVNYDLDIDKCTKIIQKVNIISEKFPSLIIDGVIGSVFERISDAEYELINFRRDINLAKRGR